MKKNLLNKGKSLMIGLAMGMKRADKEAFRQTEHSLNTDDGIEEKVVANTLMNSLLKGEVTKEVEEFRYRLYEVYNLAEQKMLAKNRRTYHVFNEENEKVEFIIENFSTNEDLSTTLNNVNAGLESDLHYNLTFHYENITPKYNLNKYLDYVCIKNGLIELYIPQLLSFDDTVKNSFLKSLAKTYDKKSYTSLFDFDKLSFITKSVYGIRDFMYYEFTDISFMGIENESNYYVVRLRAKLDKCENSIANLYDKDQDEKYKNKEKLNSTLDLMPIQPENFDECYVNEQLKEIYNNKKE